MLLLLPTLETEDLQDCQQEAMAAPKPSANAGLYQFAIKKSRFSNGSVDSICSLILENWYYYLLHNYFT
ncbi:hypothetical protein IJ00_05185 [Calothrix sp. 336/3]|uniref:hypothetical protein n=1 Tax=Calothrix sp. 336/3 TaxID=1337936 RepID=UPI0004E3BB69|nr:hypothetical protein [Calothrix sp. 336/3]AKG20782.1 hypothetical protein IJ00_05185 [Calothrix sp. 336/3]